MKPGMKMLMLNKSRESRSDGPERRGEYRGSRMEYGGSEGNYSGMNNRSNYSRNEYENEMRDMENRFRGGEGYSDRSDERMNYPQNNVYDMESRRRFPRRKDGTFAPRSGMDEEMGMTSPFVPPIYEGGERYMNQIGFAPSGYGTYATSGKSKSGRMEHGGASMRSGKMSRDMAEEWMEQIQNEDGSRGAHWTIDQAKQVMAQRNIQGDPWTFWVVLNSLYADYCKVFQKHNINKMDLYADLANAWINDKDSVEDKAAAYYMNVVKH